ncbi:hypothetical protein [Polaromonas sp. DSR2-3-2]|uniref:hypothetical protein n=1 Tax=unclassified Polaromonas TaxID=2638319 RepID=UPI003CE7CCDC
MDLSLIQGTISGLKVASDMAKGFLDLKSMAEVQGKVIELQSAILLAQSNALAANADQAAMADEIRNLKEQLAKEEAWSKEKQRYRLIAIEAGIYAYSLKEDLVCDEPPHWVCVGCLNAGAKYVLQNQGDFYGASEYLCNGCNSKIKISTSVPPES